EKLGHSSPIVTRRALPGGSGGGVGVGGGGGTSSLSSSSSSLASLQQQQRRPPLFEMRFEMNPRDAEYDAKVYLSVDQVEAVMSPTAGWVLDIVAFAQPPET
ncbi:unnamed protein product, partial [Ectocarpus sp. 12 AP-2014]